MVWNPTDLEFSNAGNSSNDLFGNYKMGGEHWIYVMNSKYDEGMQYQTLFADGTSESKTAVYEDAMWVSTTRAADGFEFLSLAEGLIPSEAKMRLRVKYPYEKQGGENPCYEFDMGPFAPSALDASAEETILDLVRVVPNPYYAFSEYENNKLDNTVKITNLPPYAIVRIFMMDGTMVRQLEIDNRGSDTAISSKNNTSQSRNEIDWKLTNFRDVPVASGMYLIHIEAPDEGVEKVIKWFGVVRPVDLDTF